MAHYLIYLPQPQMVTTADLTAVGLADLAEGFEQIPLSAGPDGSPGRLLAWRTPQDNQMHFQPAEQTWLPAIADGDAKAGRYYVGIWNHSPPTPDRLRRPYAKLGHFVTLGDGHQWLIPDAEQLADIMIKADDGSWRFEVQRQYHDYYIEARRWMATFHASDDSIKVDYFEIADFVLRALQINYRITVEVVNHLRLFDKNAIGQAMFAVIGALTAAGGVPTVGGGRS